MDFELSDDQVALQEAARDLLDKLASRERVRAVMARGGAYDRELWRAMVEQGWTALEVPEAGGGLGLGMVEAAVLLEEVGRHVAPAPFLGTLLALGALRAAGDGGAAGVAGAWAERLMNGDAIGCVAFDLAAPVIGAPEADVAVVVMGKGLVAVDLGAGPGRPAPEPAMDQTRRLGWLTLEGRDVAELGGDDAVTALLERGAVAHAAELLGGASAVLDMAVAYAKDRVQFGKPIGSFQAIKHRLADMLVDVEGMRSAVYHAAWCLAAGSAEAPVAASTAKIWCSDASRRVMASGLQVHGGIGFTWEHDLHLFLKRSQLDQVSFGDATWHRRRLAALLRARVAAGETVV
jgi:alkylation response protein AidB-like acyl-CoA dehydrogenase